MTARGNKKNASKRYRAHSSRASEQTILVAWLSSAQFRSVRLSSACFRVWSARQQRPFAASGLGPNVQRDSTPENAGIESRKGLVLARHDAASNTVGCTGCAAQRFRILPVAFLRRVANTTMVVSRQFPKTIARTVTQPTTISFGIVLFHGLLGNFTGMFWGSR